MVSIHDDLFLISMVVLLKQQEMNKFLKGLVNVSCGYMLTLGDFSEGLVA